MPATRQKPHTEATAHGFPHPLTDEERSRGGKRKAENWRAKREAAERLVLERLADEMEPFIRTHLELRDDGDQPGNVRMAAVREAYDRVLGKPGQSLEVSGPDGDPLQVEINDVRERLANRIAGVAERASATSSPSRPL